MKLYKIVPVLVCAGVAYGASNIAYGLGAGLLTLVFLKLGDL